MRASRRSKRVFKAQGRRRWQRQPARVPQARGAGPCPWSWLGAGLRAGDDTATQADLAVVQHGALARSDRPLRLLKAQAEAAGAGLEMAGRVALAVARLGGDAGFDGWGVACPAKVVGRELLAQQPGVLVALHDIERVARHVLAGHEPGRMFATSARRALFFHAADAQALALAQGVEGQAHMLAQFAAALVLDRARLMGQVAVQKLAEGPLADEADAGRVLLLRLRQAD